MELFTEMKICTHNQAKKIPGSGINVDKFDSKKFKKTKEMIILNSRILVG